METVKNVITSGNSMASCRKRISSGISSATVQSRFVKTNCVMKLTASIELYFICIIVYTCIHCTHALAHTHAHMHAHTHTHTHTHTHSHTHTHTLSLSLSLSHTNTHTHTHTLSLSLSLTHTHSYTQKKENSHASWGTTAWPSHDT